jgi:hypothetical protein
MKLEVANAHYTDVYKDMARVLDAYRLDAKGAVIPEGRTCKVYVGSESIFLSLRGHNDHKNPAIHIDEKTRTALGVQIHDQVDFTFHQVGWWGQFRWAWNASDPAYRIAARLGFVSLILGVIGLLLGIIGILK